MKIQAFEMPAENGAKYLFYCPGCHCNHWFNDTWTWNGDVNKPTINPSILVRSGNEHGDTRCHSFVRDGQIQFLNDCSHDLKGQTVDLPDWDSET